MVSVFHLRKVPVQQYLSIIRSPLRSSVPSLVKGFPISFDQRSFALISGKILLSDHPIFLCVPSCPLWLKVWFFLPRYALRLHLFRRALYCLNNVLVSRTAAQIS